MAWITHLIFLSWLHLCWCDCVINHQTLEEAWEKKLDKDLKKNYVWSVNPNPCTNTEVEISFTIRSFDMDSENDIFTMYSRMRLSWFDSRLMWNPRDYGGITETLMHHVFWVPYLELNNRQGDDYGSFINDDCKIASTGHVTCTIMVLDSAQCTAYMSKWPYDTQKCTLEYKISEDQKDVYLISNGGRAVSMMGADYGPEFTIVDYYQVLNRSDKVQLRITFVLDRNGEYLAAIIIFPSILLSILTVCSIILDVNDRNRLLMILFSMCCHWFYLSEIGWEIPKQSEDPPSILLFYKSSSVLTLFLIIATVIIGKLRNKESAPPALVSSVYSIVFNSPVKYFIWPRWKTNIDLLTSEDVDVKCVEVWNGFANIANSACFFVSVIVYSIMIPVYVPTQQPYT